MDRGVVWTSRQGCTVNGAWIGGEFWDAYDVFSRFLNEKEALVMAELLQKILHGTGLERHRDLLDNGMTDAPK